MSATRHPRLEAGTLIDGVYNVVDQIGAGGMATVYKAWQSDAERPVAIKVIDYVAEDASDQRKKFFNELLLATRVQHPNVVEIYDFGILASGQPYIVMELLRGVSLASALKANGGIPEERAVSLYLGALGALRVAHELGVVHKDLKPANLFLCRPGEPDESLVVLDFGIAHRASADSGAAEEFAGTPQYSAPEALLGEELTPAVDVYQMAIALVETISGQRLVKTRDIRECLVIHTQGKLELPDAVLNGRLAPVIKRGLSRKPQDRFQSAGAMLDAISAVFERTAPILRSRALLDPVRRRIQVPPTPGGGGRDDEDAANPTVLMASDRWADFMASTDVRMAGAADDNAPVLLKETPLAAPRSGEPAPTLPDPPEPTPPTPTPAQAQPEWTLAALGIAAAVLSFVAGGLIVYLAVT